MKRRSPSRGRPVHVQELRERAWAWDPCSAHFVTFWESDFRESEDFLLLFLFGFGFAFPNTEVVIMTLAVWVRSPY